VKATIPNRAVETAYGWVLYDGECSLCVNTSHRFAGLLHRHGFELAALQTTWVRERFGFSTNATPDEMLVITPEQTVFGGADGIVQIARRIWWAWPLFVMAQIPAVMILLRAIYRRVAAKRHCLNGVCRLKKAPHRHITAKFFEMP
jgi:predicted DCC family thiol-disulfide oxidoreductase YuxK